MLIIHLLFLWIGVINKNMFDFNNGGYIIFNGVSSKKYNLKLMTRKLSTESLENIAGISREVIEEDGINYTSQFLEIKPKKENITFELVKATSNNIADTFTEKQLREIKRWLYTEEGYKPLKVNGYTYDVIFVDLEQSLINAKGQGSLILTVTTSDGLKHSNKCIVDIVNKNNNISRIEHFYTNFTVGTSVTTELQITQLDKNKGDIILSSKTNPSKIIIKDLNYLETARVINGEIYSMQDNSHNLFTNTIVNSADCFHVNYGYNEVELEGLAKVQLAFRANYSW